MFKNFDHSNAQCLQNLCVCVFGCTQGIACMEMMNVRWCLCCCHRSSGACISLRSYCCHQGKRGQSDCDGLAKSHQNVDLLLVVWQQLRGEKVLLLLLLSTHSFYCSIFHFTILLLMSLCCCLVQFSHKWHKALLPCVFLDDPTAVG